MTIDLVTGNVTTIRVQDQEFDVVRHIHSSLVLFGRGTHVFVVRDKAGQCHILKDAWLLVGHGLSEITSLSEINHIIKEDPSPDGAAYRSNATMHPQFVVGQDIGDSTKERRGRLTDKPPERVHRRIVTGPVGDPITSFRSRREFLQVILDCVKWLDFLHNKVKMVHGDISINNIVISRAPAPPPRPSKGHSKKVSAAHPLPILDEQIPTFGVVIDYDYARQIGTVLNQTSGTPPFMPLDALRFPGKYLHDPRHDLESLIQTAISVMTFCDGPCGVRRTITDYVPISRWFNEIDREQLFKDKSVDLKLYSDTEIEDKLAPYWKSLSSCVRQLIKATWNQPLSSTIHQDYVKILENALRSLEEEVSADYGVVHQKRPRPDSADESRYPGQYIKFRRTNDLSTRRLPRPAHIQLLSRWEDSVDAI
ncbi:hypothetical protein HYPSUDRAFT_150541 [Hypholoma sublateritium FD-334 SS-4]|uniref:Fungal-type protein kinase domain-containing protein n=1 Tax=Hypholoma sublateritium (strain FD-334 SS-4) TaxID=945553 RepID=A0A0D2LTZ9_HYPSF|nr:hypothetical protein HYPSUDRAFT_150541 [Hypholoma sublateritium FD-334 SS-4]